MVVTDFKEEQPDKKAQQTVASSRSDYRQTVPSEAEEDTSYEMHDYPPPYEASSSYTTHNHDPFSSNVCSTTSPQDQSARMIRRPHSSSSSSRDDGDDSIDRDGYQRAAKMTMTWDEKDASGYWAKHEHETGACCSRRGGCVFSDRGGCCFSDREACCFSDRDGCCFSDRDACCCSEDGGCCFAVSGGCCFSGTRAGERRWRRPVPSTGTLFKGLF
ncbi:hypothetical protein BBO_06935 [Beauveria brongniartii RCEF 3172]|uniref:Uncharacterized protein n=1 Tax=Beauveria brongniartii RCEF 3172 TaxID=1081107 RepID=A0A162J2V2_9HYPO|nr:hypothetical protein BBO_06935 [Beauveria brongniartii RCEF 3172]